MNAALKEYQQAYKPLEQHLKALLETEDDGVFLEKLMLLGWSFDQEIHIHRLAQRYMDSGGDGKLAHAAVNRSAAVCEDSGLYQVLTDAHGL